LKLGLVDKIIPYLAIEQVEENNMDKKIEKIFTAEEVATQVALAIETERERILAIQKIGGELSIPHNTITHTIKASMTFEVAKDTFGMVREAVEASREIETTQRMTSSKQSLAQQVGLKGE